MLKLKRQFYFSQLLERNYPRKPPFILTSSPLNLGEVLIYVLLFSVAPSCKPNQTRVYGVAKQERAQIICQVEANPPDVHFRWTFNNSADSVDVASSHIARSGTSSVVSYTPMTELDYGTLLCYASNKIGNQRVPCVFHIIAAGKSSFPVYYPFKFEYKMS